MLVGIGAVVVPVVVLIMAVVDAVRGLGDVTAAVAEMRVGLIEAVVVIALVTVNMACDSVILLLLL